MSERFRSLFSWVLTLLLGSIILVGLALGDERPANRAEALGQRIRCPVCQGESIADSPSETARAMMIRVTEQIADGSSDAEIISFFQARYGEGILLDPPLRGATLALWVLPVVAVAVGVALVAGRLRARERADLG